MYRFALCEDEQVSLEYLGERIEQEFTRRMGTGDRREPGFKLDRYGRAEELLAAASRGIRYDVMFLDIVMPEIDGFEICRRLRTWEKETLIVFVSANEELVFQSFDVQPFAFLRKNHIWSDLEMVAGKLLHRLSQSDAEQIAIQEEQSGKVHMLSVQTTIYVEAQIHQCRVRIVNGEFFMRCRFRDVGVSGAGQQISADFNDAFVCSAGAV